MKLEDVLGEGNTPVVPVQVPSTVLAPVNEPDSIVTVEDLLNAGPYCYLSGIAGSGKTFLARQLALRKDTLLAATTGIAAVNLGDAVTIHSLLGFHDKESLRDRYASGGLHTKLRNLIKMGFRRIVIDEVSMMSAEMLTLIVKAIEAVATTSTYDADLQEVVGEEREGRRIALVLVGDFAQLPPIEEPFAFESEEWWRFEEQIFKLTKIWRQTDQAYVKALLAIRRGDPRSALPTLKGRFTNKLNLDDYPGTTIVSKNDEVERINQMRHARLPGSPVSWKTIRSGEQRPEWVKQIPNDLLLKPGALIMVLANRYDPVEHRILYANGDTGEVIGKVEEAKLTAEEIEAYEEIGAEPPQAVVGIKVLLKRTLQEIVIEPILREWTEPYIETEVEELARKKREAELKIKIAKPRRRLKGSITYMPLRLAYATTVHRSQGLSLDAVQVAIAGPGSWMFEKPGMTYVAFSRCRSLEGLTIVGSDRVLLGKAGVDPKVKRWV